MLRTVLHIFVSYFDMEGQINCPSGVPSCKLHENGKLEVPA